MEGSTYLAGLRRAAEIDEHARDRDDDVEQLHERRRASARELVDGRRARSIALASGLEQAPGDAIRSLWRAAQAENSMRTDADARLLHGAVAISNGIISMC